MKRCTNAVAILLLGLAVSGVRADDGKDDGKDEEMKTMDYKQALEDSFRFYEAQRSGILPRENRIPWRDDSALLDKIKGQDLVGGYYDSADMRKVTHPLAFTLSAIGWSLLEFKDGYEGAEQLEFAEEMLRWGLEYMLKAYYDDGALVTQVGNTTQEMNWWGRPEESMNDRPAYTINEKRAGPDVAGAAAAAMAVGSLVFENKDRDFSGDLRKASEDIYDKLVKDQEGTAWDTLSQDEQQWGEYKSSGESDDQLWAALWLYRATNDKKYLEDAEGFLKTAKDKHSKQLVWSWDQSLFGSLVLLQHMGRSEQAEDGMVEAFFSAWMDGSDKYNIKHNSEGFAYYTDGNMNRTNGDAAAAALLALLAAPKQGRQTADEYRCFAQRQINYLLGDNKADLSYMVGFGDNFPQRVIHRAASCPEPAAAGMRGNCSWGTVMEDRDNHHVLVGALVSGDGQSADKFRDSRGDWRGNVASLDNNAGITGALAALAHEDSRCGSGATLEKDENKDKDEDKDKDENKDKDKDEDKDKDKDEDKDKDKEDSKDGDDENVDELSIAG